jgi:hypothetical protein
MQRHFHEELDALTQTLLAMGGLVDLVDGKMVRHTLA